MATKPKSKVDAAALHETKVTFKCRLCGKDKPLEDMRTVTRFNPVLIVCQECARTLH